MTLEKTLQCLNLESYRLRLFGTNETNLVGLVRDLAEIRQAIVARRQQPVVDAAQAE